MHWKFSSRILIYVLCVFLLIIPGISFDSSPNKFADASPFKLVPISSSSVVDLFQLPVQEEPPQEPESTLIPQEAGSSETSATLQEAGSPEATAPSEIIVQPEVIVSSEVTVTEYETTAYYLNVRAEGNNQSQILDVVKKGTKLEVVATTDNGWLKLKGEGYVHGGYVKRISDQSKQLKPVKALSLDISEPSKPTSTVISDSGLTQEQITEIFEGTALIGEGLEEAVLEIEDEYGINAYFTIAVMKLESGNGRSKMSQNKNNLFGLQAMEFEKKEDSVHKFGQLIFDHYVGKGYTTIEKVAKKYCPANPKWPSLVKNIMNRDYTDL